MKLKFLKFQWKKHSKVKNFRKKRHLAGLDYGASFLYWRTKWDEKLWKEEHRKHYNSESTFVKRFSIFLASAAESAYCSLHILSRTTG